MGKSPGKWMKTLIFGKKSSRSKSNNSKPNVEKIDVPVYSYQRTELKTEENLQPHNSQDQVCISATTELNAQNDSDSDRIREEQAAIDLQAALRGYLARRTFQNLKGIIRLQALVRGHLVRRQAISTLYCMFQIVKLQALARGRKIRNLNTGIQVRKRPNPINRLVMASLGVNRSMQMLKLSSNGFAQKIIASSPNPMPLHFQYDSNDANSVLSWLERWSTSQCWQLLSKPTSGDRSKPQKSHTRRSSMTNVENIVSEFDKPMRNLRKVSQHKPVNCIEEDPALVLERIKRNLRKVDGSVLHNTNDIVQKTITEPEKPRVSEAETVILKKNDEEDENDKERKKSRRVVCDPVKQESRENYEPLQIKRSVPGYMMATVSAKAKLRGQDGAENTNTITRRYSLPSLTNANFSVSSPRARTTGKLKNDRSLRLSRDGNVIVKVNQAEWRR